MALAHVSPLMCEMISILRMAVWSSARTCMNLRSCRDECATLLINSRTFDTPLPRPVVSIKFLSDALDHSTHDVPNDRIMMRWFQNSKLNRHSWGTLTYFRSERQCACVRPFMQPKDVTSCEQELKKMELMLHNIAKASDKK